MALESQVDQDMGETCEYIAHAPMDAVELMPRAMEWLERALNQTSMRDRKIKLAFPPESPGETKFSTIRIHS